MINEIIIENLDPNEKNVCWICDKKFSYIPHNAEPISIGVCCNECNLEKVIPARLERIKNG